MNASEDSATYWSFRSGAAASLGQRRLWTMQRADPADPTYNLLSAMRILGELDPAGLRASFLRAVRRHESLRTRFLSKNGALTRTIEPFLPIDMERCDLRQISDAQLREATVRKIAWNLAREPFDLENGPLLRLTLIATGAGEHVLLLCIHHLIADGWSLGLLIAEIAEGYSIYRRGAGLPVDPPVYGIENYIDESLKAAASEQHKTSVEYWRQRLDAVRWSALTPDFENSGNALRRSGRNQRFSFPEALARLDLACRACMLTRYQFMIATFIAFIGRQSGCTDVAIATLLGNRLARQHQELIGFLANTIGVRCSLSPNESTRDFLARCSQELQQSIRHGSVSFYTLADQAPQLFTNGPNILFSLQNNPLPEFKLGDLTFEMLNVDCETSKFDLSLYVADVGGRLDIWVEYDAALYHERTIEDLVTRYVGYLAELCAIEKIDQPLDARDFPITHYSRMSALERSASRKPILDSLLDEIATRPDASAYVIGQRVYRYRDLWAGLSEIARQLDSLGCRLGDRVILLGDRSFVQLCAIWACLGRGFTFVPLPNDLPPGKLDAIVRDVQPSVVLVDDEKWLTISSRAALYARSDDADALQFSERALLASQLRSLIPDSLDAYILYTSGSTGVPKGVAVSTANLAILFAGLDGQIPRAQQNTWLAVSSIAFDIATLEVLWAVSRGFRVVIFDVKELYSRKPIASTASYPRSKRDIKVSLCYFPDMDQYTPDQHQALFTESVRWADQHRFFGVWTPERHFGRFGTAFTNPALTSAYLSQLTQNIQIRAGSVVGPLHHTARLAEDWAALSRMSGGRVGFSLAAGWNPQDFVLSTGALGRKRDIVQQQIAELRQLWSGHPVAFADASGRYFATQLALPPQAPIPLSLTISNRPEQFRFAAIHRLDVFTHLLEQNLDQLAQNIAVYRQTWRDLHGAASSCGTVTLMMHTFIAASDEEARSEAMGPFSRYLHASIDALAPQFKSPSELARLKREFEPQRGELIEHVAREMIDGRSLICGRESAERRLHALRFAGVDEVACLVDFGIEPAKVIGALPLLDAARAPDADRDPDRIRLHNEWHGVTHLQCTPSLAKILLEQPAFRAVLQNMECWLLGGEELSASLASRIERASNARRFNMYGPTEATVWASMAHVPDGAARVPLGAPLPGARLYVLDSRLRDVPAGVAGDLYIGGAGVAQGYVGRPGLTAQSFIPDPFGPAGSRMYATGDRARLTTGGELIFLGRGDTQIKLNGHRLELSAMADELCACAGVSQAVVTAYRGGSGGGGELEIVAFVVLDSGIDAAWREALTSHLARYFEVPNLPRHFLRLDALPLTQNQKTDHAALLRCYREYQQTQQMPATATECSHDLTHVRQAWLMFLPGTGDIQENFFSLGGNSLLAMRLIAHCNETWNSRVTLQEFYRDPTIRGLANCLASAQPSPARAIPQRVGRDRDRYPVSHPQRAMLFLAQMQVDNSAYHDSFVVQLQGQVSRGALRQAFEGMLRRHEIFRTGYRLEGGEFFQMPIDAAQYEPCFEVEGLDPSLGSLRDDVLAARLRSFIDAPFDLENGRVVRAKLLDDGLRTAYLCLAFHHIVTDGWSIRIVLRQLLEDYAQILGELPVDFTRAEWQYSDFATWQAEDLKLQRPALLKFWREYCSGIQQTFLPSRRLASGAPDERPLSLGSLRVALKFDALLVRDLEQLAREHQVTLFAVLVAALCVVMEAHCGQEDLCIATDAANRSLPEFAKIPGIMVNQILLRVKMPQDSSMWNFVQDTHSRVAAAFSHQALPYDLLLSDLNPPRRGGNSSLFDVKLVMNELEPDPPQALPFSIRELDVAVRAVKFGVLLNLFHRETTLFGHADFDPSRFERAYVERFCEHYLAVLDELRRVETLGEMKRRLSLQLEHDRLDEEGELQRAVRSRLVQVKRRSAVEPK